MHDLKIPGTIPKLSKNGKIIQYGNLDVKQIIIINLKFQGHTMPKKCQNDSFKDFL